ncbi:MAG: hypothetical protein WAV05_19645 [Anaerolineales bacterium]
MDLANWVGIPLRAGVRMIDRVLRIHSDVHEFSQDAECILRIQLRNAPHPVNLGNVNIIKREPVLALHLWNEHMPKLHAEGAELEWALKLRRQIIQSFRGVAKVIQDDSRYSRVKAVFGISTLFSFTDHIGGTRMMQHLGFTVLPYRRPMGRFGEFWENLFSWWLMWTYNETSLRSRKFWRLERTEIWMTAEKFLLRYGE